MGFIEERVEKVSSCPSVQIICDDEGDYTEISTHDQVVSNGVYLGSIFPSNDYYKTEEYSSKRKLIANEMSRQGYRGFVSVGFVANNCGIIYAIELNTRRSATTHPYCWTKILTKSSYNNITGKLANQHGGNIVYISTEYFFDEVFIGLSNKEIVHFFKSHSLNYNYSKYEEIVLHMISTCSRYGKIGRNHNLYKKNIDNIKLDLVEKMRGK